VVAYVRIHIIIHICVCQRTRRGGYPGWASKAQARGASIARTLFETFLIWLHRAVSQYTSMCISHMPRSICLCSPPLELKLVGNHAILHYLNLTHLLVPRITRCRWRPSEVGDTSASATCAVRSLDVIHLQSVCAI
jgi:hypothetical protein